MWITITETHLKTRLSDPELTAFKSVALAAGQANPVSEIIADVTNLIRGYVANCQRNRLGSDGTIPDKLLSSALAIIVMQVMTRAAGKVIDPNGVRQKASEDAIRLMEQVAGCKFAVEIPDDFSSENIQNFTPTISSRDFRFRDQDGI